MDRTARIRGILAFAACFATLAAAGCGDDGGDATDPGFDPAPDVTTDPGIDPGTDPGTPEDPGGPIDVPHDPGQPDTPVGNCTPPCDYQEGKYCDPADRQCKKLACGHCLRDADCDVGQVCAGHLFRDGSRGNVCTRVCTDDEDCAGGWACGDGTPRTCVPMALCPADCGTGAGALGDPCSQGGSNATCGQCADTLTCIGTAPVAANACDFPRDCIARGVDRLLYPDCVDGRCGWSICASSCLQSNCPEGYLEFRPNFTVCWCVPTGDSGPGDACPIFNVNLDADSCRADETCLGIEASDETDACTEDADCPKANYYGNPECVDGRCGTSFCSPKCGPGGTCPTDFEGMDVGGTCYCIPLPVGTSEAGAPCPIFNVHPDADNCRSGLTCLGIAAGAEGPVCTEDADCQDIFVGNTDCVDGRCGTSFCSPRCNDQNRCTGAFSPILIGDGQGNLICYCAPVEVGTSQAGDACPIFGMHQDAEACAAQLICLGIEPTADQATCTTAEDCPADDYFGNPDCVDGHCGSSFCSPYCDDLFRCEDGFLPAEVSGDCLCIPTEVGTSTAFQACPSGETNAAADACAGGLICLGLTGEDRTALCGKDGDCDFPNGDCVDGLCGFSYCAPYCDDQGACDEGEPYTLSTGTCACIYQEPTGTAALGDACPFGNVGLGAERCGADLYCGGMWAGAETPACSVPGDCPSIGVPWDCVQDRCGWGWCQAECTTAGGCDDAAATAYVYRDGGCMCQGVEPGARAAGDACAFGMLNPGAGPCAAGLACVAVGPIRLTEQGCGVPGDCPAVDFPGGVTCVDGFCASTFCAAPCGAGEACDLGFAPVTVDDRCWCQPVPAT